MKHDDMLRMAREAGFDGQEFTGGSRKGQPAIFDSGDVCIDSYLMRFAAIVCAADRERCAKVIDGILTPSEDASALLRFAAHTIRSLKP